MTAAPMIRHARWCHQPPLRPSTSILDRAVTRWRCPECDRQAVVIGGGR